MEIFSTGGKEWLLTPLFDLSAGGYELNFDVALTVWNSTASGTISADDAVYLMQSTDAGTTWTTINTWNSGNSPSNTGDNTTINISAVNSATTQFAFFMLEGPTSGGDFDFFVDNFQVRTPPSCPAPSALSAINVTTTGADLGWTNNGSATVWDLEIGTSGFAPTGTPTFDNVGANPFTWTGGSASSTYDFYVRADCSADNVDVSVWVGPFTFNTTCGAVNVPYTQDFESAVIPAFPTCMSVQNVNGNTTWTTATSTYVGPSSKAARYTYSSTSAANDWFYTSGINLVGGTNYTLSYTYGAAGFNESLEVYYGTSASAASMTNLVVDNGTFLNGPFTVSYTITPAATGVYYFGWHAYSGADEFWLDVDNISVVLAPVPDCLGVPGGTATIGSACDDGNASTGNDVYDANCDCVGQLIDCLGVPGGSATIGSSCDDGNASTGNDVYDANCTCVGQTIDCLGVPGGSATIGSSCDDGNAATIDDTWSANCTCEGTPVGACTGNEVVVAINTDNNPGQITWELTNESNVVIATGGPTAGQTNMLVNTTVCLGTAPTSACYGFKLMDSFGDGITGGGWELRTTNGKLLLRDDFAGGSVSPAIPSANPSYGTTHSFCLPQGPANIAP
ncbi:MAG: hypothetical protein ABIY71_03090, partial [Flavobacteriales bacterium]